MHKRGVSKYSNLEWQMVRVSLKDFKDNRDKIAKALEYLDKEPTFQTYVRVVNYLEGLALGYKNPNPEAYKHINEVVAKYHQLEDQYKWADDDGERSQYVWTRKQLMKCYKDNMKRYTNYASKGYFHKEIYDFCKSFSFAEIELIESFKEEALSKNNTHHFFF